MDYFCGNRKRRCNHAKRDDIINIHKAGWAGAGGWRGPSGAGLTYHRVWDTPASARG